MGMKQIAEGTADFLGLNRSALSASSAVNSSRTFPSFFVASRAFLCLFVANPSDSIFFYPFHPRYPRFLCFAAKICHILASSNFLLRRSIP